MRVIDYPESLVWVPLWGNARDLMSVFQQLILPKPVPLLVTCQFFSWWLAITMKTKMLWFVVTWYVKVLPVCFGVGRIFIILFLPPISRAWWFGQIKYKERNKWCSMYETTSSFRQQRVHTYGFFLYDLAITIKTKMLWFVVTWSVESFTYFFDTR